MTEIKIKHESQPTRCEICHKADLFDPETNSCSRCVGLRKHVERTKQLLTGTLSLPRDSRRTPTVPTDGEYITLPLTTAQQLKSTGYMLSSWAAKLGVLLLVIAAVLCLLMCLIFLTALFQTMHPGMLLGLLIGGAGFAFIMWLALQAKLLGEKLDEKRYEMINSAERRQLEPAHIGTAANDSAEKVANPEAREKLKYRA